MKHYKVVQIGLGPIGQKMIQYVSERNELEIVGAADVDPGKTGKDLGGVCGLGRQTGIPVADDLGGVLQKTRPDVAILSTVSGIDRLLPQLETVARHKVSIVSTCEELSYPWITHPETSRKIDELAKKYGISILGTGVNPGFLMDFLPLAFTGVCRKVESIRVSRIQDASRRRIPFQNKIGAGLTPEEFESRKQAGTLRHVGLTESMHMIAARMGWPLDATEDVITPIIAETDVNAGERTIEAGRVLGVQQIGHAFSNGREVITLVFRAALGITDPEDTIEIDGEPRIHTTIPGGVNGDVATCAITVNAIRSIMESTPGLKTMADIPVVSCF